MKPTVNLKEDKHYRKLLKHRIRLHNNVVSPYHLESRKEGYIKYFDIRLDNAELGGLTGSIYWNLMEIDDLFVDESLRRKGNGKLLLNEAIKLAKELRLSYILLKTFSFQAKDFYLKFGFIVIGEITDYPPGESFYTMRLNI